MTDELKKDATADLSHIKSVLESDELKAKAWVLNVWTRWEVWVCLGGGLVIGIALEHFVGK